MKKCSECNKSSVVWVSRVNKHFCHEHYDEYKMKLYAELEE